jgi:hypothetical protein
MGWKKWPRQSLDAIFEKLVAEFLSLKATKKIAWGEGFAEPQV